MTITDIAKHADIFLYITLLHNKNASSVRLLFK